MIEKSFTPESIVLLEAKYRRNAQVDYEDENFTSEVKFSIQKDFDEEKIGITLSIDFTSRLKEIIQIEISVKYIGIFISKEADQESKERFARITGPEIIFPFVREKIASLSISGGLRPIYLPTLNFKKFEFIEEGSTEIENSH